MQDVKIIRAFWGTDFSEVPTTPQFNELVYVFGKQNQAVLDKMGYETEIISLDPFGGEVEINKFLNKLKVIYRACQDFKQFIFLDWDMKQIKPLDEAFYDSLQDKKILMPTYSYPIEYLKLKNKLEGHAAMWTNNLIPLLKKWSWRLEDSLIIPNGGFIYVNEPSFGKDMFKIVEDKNINANVEELAFFLYANCTLDEYIEEYEPMACFGRPADNRFVLGDIDKQAETKLHNHIKSLIEKDEYFLHL